MKDWSVKPAMVLSVMASSLMGLGIATSASAAPADSRATAAASYAPIGGLASVPYGWADFCSRQFQECSQPALPAVDIKFTAAPGDPCRKEGPAPHPHDQPISHGHQPNAPVQGLTPQYPRLPMQRNSGRQRKPE